jgi:transposase
VEWDITYVGLDTSKKSIQVAMFKPGEKDAVDWQEANDTRGVKRLVKRLKREAPGELRTCYEAGPCGYALQRQLRAAGVECVVVAPSLIPVKPGERVKTDRRDARKLGEFLRAGTLTEVHPPTPEQEAARDLCRCREDVRQDLERSRHRLGKLLLRRALGHPGRAWTQAHRSWLRSLQFEEGVDRAVFDDYLLAIEHLEERLRGLEEKLAALSVQEPYRDAVGWLRCFRGIDTVTAMTIVTELHGFERFRTARELMSYLGLVPSEHSSGSKQRRGAITKAGNSHLRRVLIEAAWHYRHRPRQSAKLRQRREGQPAWAIAIADRAQQRLHKRFWRLLGHGKAHNKTVTAVARELVGFIWATLSQRERSVAVETPKESKTATTYRIKKVTDGAANRRRSGRRAAA